MAYRKDSEAALRWRGWCLKNRAILSDCRIPEKVFSDEMTWWEFLEHGWRDDFDLKGLSESQQQAFCDWLEAELSEDEKKFPPLALRYLRGILKK
jgi:hypothetical protein